MANKYYQKQKEIPQKEPQVKDIKIFLKKKKTKGEKRSEKDIKIFLKKKQKLLEYMKNYFLVHKNVIV